MHLSASAVLAIVVLFCAACAPSEPFKGTARSATVGENEGGPAPAEAVAVLHKNDAEPLGSVLIQDVPHVRQKPDFCGEACVAAYL